MLNRSKHGYTLIELLVIIAILGSLLYLPQLLSQTRQILTSQIAKLELQRDARTSINSLEKFLKPAVASSVVIDREANQPYYSRLSCSYSDGTQLEAKQLNTDLIITVGGKKNKLTHNLRNVTFAIPTSVGGGLVSIMLTVEKKVYGNQKRTIHVTSENLRMMN